MIDLRRAKLTCLPMGARLYGGGGGDGGYQQRQDAMRREQDAAISQINNVFGRGEGNPIYQNRTTTVPGPGRIDENSGGFQPGALTRQTTRTRTGWDTTERDRNLAERERLYSTIMGDAEARLLGDLGDDRTKAERQVRFQLARQGLAGGSADIDQGREILEQFQEGSLEARQAGLGAANSARSSDEKTRVGLINNIRQGMAESDALSAAYAGMQGNADTARDQAMSTDIGNFFDDLAILQNQNRFRQDYDERQRQLRSSIGTSGNTGGFGGNLS